MCLGKVVLWLRAACICVIRACQLSWSTSALSTAFRRMQPLCGLRQAAAQGCSGLVSVQWLHSCIQDLAQGFKVCSLACVLSPGLSAQIWVHELGKLEAAMQGSTPQTGPDAT